MSSYITFCLINIILYKSHKYSKQQHAIYSLFHSIWNLTLCTYTHWLVICNLFVYFQNVCFFQFYWKRKTFLEIKWKREIILCNKLYFTVYVYILYVCETMKKTKEKKMKIGREIYKTANPWWSRSSILSETTIAITRNINRRDDIYNIIFTCFDVF